MKNVLIHLLLFLFLSPLLPGIINKTKAFFAGRKGAPFFQPYFDILKLFRKGLVVSTAASWIFMAGPIVTLVAVATAGLLIPLGPFDSPLSFTGDVILFVYLFGLARFFTTAAALDTGSSFEGMGAAREVTFAVLSEPALFFALLVLARVSGSFRLSDILHGPIGGVNVHTVAPFVLVSIGLYIVMLAEASRVPVDDPTTHLELTMIHEAMVLDHSGPLLGMVQYSSSLKLFILGALLLHLVVPFRAPQEWLNWLLFVAEIFAVAVSIGVVESIMARLKMKKVPYLLTGALILCASGFILLVR